MRLLQRLGHALRIVGVLILALLCIGGPPLLVCKLVDPVLYDKVISQIQTHLITPTVATVGHLAAQGKQYWDTCTDWLSNQWNPPPPPNPADEVVEPESQAAAEPELTDGGAVISDPAVSQWIQQDGQEILSGGIFPIFYFNQADPAWNTQRYGVDPMSSHGCGPTVMAMAVSSLTETKVTPTEMANWAVSNGSYARHSGSYHNIVPRAAAAFGLKAEGFQPRDATSLRTELMGGHLFVALMRKGHFTNSGHFILLRGVTMQGDILVADPYSRERSMKAWSPDIILGELSTATDADAPLWKLSIS